MTATAADALRDLVALSIDGQVEVALGLLRDGAAGPRRLAVMLLRHAIASIESRAQLRAAMPKERAGLERLLGELQRVRAPKSERVYPKGSRYHGD